MFKFYVLNVLFHHFGWMLKKHSSYSADIKVAIYFCGAQLIAFFQMG